MNFWAPYTRKTQAGLHHCFNCDCTDLAFCIKGKYIDPQHFRSKVSRQSFLMGSTFSEHPHTNDGRSLFYDSAFAPPITQC